MIGVGGVCFILCGLLNEVFKWDTVIWKDVYKRQMLDGTKKLNSGREELCSQSKGILPFVRL